MLKERIQEELNRVLKKGDQISCLVLRMLLAAITNKEKEKKYREKLEKSADLSDEEIIEVVSSEARKRKEAISEYEKGNRPRLAEKEKSELKILEKYLPEQLSEAEIKKLVEEAIEKLGVQEPKDFGRVMAGLMPKIKGRADGSQVSKIVKELLS